MFGFTSVIFSLYKIPFQDRPQNGKQLYVTIVNIY